MCYVSGFIGSQNQSKWNIDLDQEIIAWATQKPEDWQLGGRCEVYLWGSGRFGQMGEAGRNSCTPILTPSFSQAQQVCLVRVVVCLHCNTILVIFNRAKIH